MSSPKEDACQCGRYEQDGTRVNGNCSLSGATFRDTCTSYSSTNDTRSNLPGPGRVLGNFYSYAGRNIERAAGIIAHKAGFGPEAVYSKILDLYQTKWENDENKSMFLLLIYNHSY